MSLFMGPVISQKAKERILYYIEKGIQEGANLALDGRKPELPEKIKMDISSFPLFFPR